jgi:hypothetical protein
LIDFRTQRSRGILGALPVRETRCAYQVLPGNKASLRRTLFRSLPVFAMEIFTTLFGNLLAFVYHCFDRIVIHGYLRALSRPE